ncbi:ABC transporter permease [Desulfohalobium retbaense]|uniref:Binding-protein-dependent transport systems inner membrane component n=1 Tax=Desulfohalobium retbaense (strain ATCC 49708 / DSM 5692 / JCM 16813 / HR100) TaxID=485915 RepID=C8X583_DESRD|nr:ABC transporter permease [Desulfohalobium retbaense]ACV69580.1 binding-protein-dependent transport systems inner membrane component [Desulfohalobium retbaense DSM 5692]
MRRRFLNCLWPLAVLAGLLVFWEIGVAVWDMPHYILPPPSRIAQALLAHWPRLVPHALTTCSEIVLGFGVALAAGLLLGAGIAGSRILERALLPLVIGSQTIPVFAIAPLLVLWFGYGIGSKVVMAALIVFFPITVSTVQGLKAADRDLLDLLRVLEAGRWRIFWTVRVPQALPHIFAGAKIGMAVSVIGAVIGEWVGARQGLGYYMVQANAQMQVDRVFAAIVLLSMIGVGLYALVVLVERWLTPWRRT